MTQSAPPPVPERVSTAGAWLGAGIAARAAAGTVAHLAPLVVVAGIPLFVDVLDRNARAQEAPPEFARWTDLWLELTSILRPYARTAGGSGVALGLVLFVAAALLVRGSPAGRRATRWILVASAAHTVAATVWMSSLALGPLAGWGERYAKALADLQEVFPGIEDRLPIAFADPGRPSVPLYVCVCLMSVGLDLVLFRLAGRAFARDWCAARAATRPVATPAVAR